LLQTVVHGTRGLTRRSQQIQTLDDRMIWPKDRLTRFEVARLVGARSLQIALGAPVLVQKIESGASIVIAKSEFKANLLPMTVKRELPNDEKVIVDIKSAISNWLEDHAGEV